MYLDYFSLKIKPFQITADPKFLWLGEKHKEALATLRYGILDNRGFLLLTGEVGTGKTILINRLITLLDMDTVVATLPDPDLESMDFYNLLADGFNMKRTFESKGAFLIHLRDFLHQSYAKQQQVLLIIDESQRLNHRLMEDIRVLSNIELHDRKLINIFFVGQQEFNSILMTPQNRALSQRITVRYHIEPLDQNETGNYILHRLKVAGSHKNLFKKPAVSEVFKVSGGIPRLINIVCDHALLTAYARNTKLIDEKIIRECAEELRIPIQKPQVDAATVKTYEDKKDMSGKPAPARHLTAGHAPTSNKESTAQKTARQSNPPAIWRLVYALVVISLILGIAFLTGKFSGRPDQIYKEEDLTPQKYKTSLEMEKARLEDSLSGNGAQNSGHADQVIPESEPEKVVEPPQPDAAQQVDETAVLTGEKAAPPENSAVPEDKLEPLPLMTEKVIIPFDINSNEIDENSYPILDKISNYLIDHPQVVLYVRGYTDNRGASSYNESVSRFRANAVKSYLIGKGAYPDNIRVFAMGAVNPVASNATVEGRRKNRRVELEFQ